MGVVGEEDDLTMDYVRDEEEEEEEEEKKKLSGKYHGKILQPQKSHPLNTGYQFRPSDRCGDIFLKVFQ